MENTRKRAVEIQRAINGLKSQLNHAKNEVEIKRLNKQIAEYQGKLEKELCIK